MAVIDNDIWVGIWVGDGPEAHHITTGNLFVIDGAVKEAMTEQAKPEERVGNPFRKEDTPNTSIYSGESKPHAANDDVLEDSGVASEW